MSLTNPNFLKAKWIFAASKYLPLLKKEILVKSAYKQSQYV